MGVALAQTALLGVAGCAVDPARFTLPGAGVPGPTYRINIQFTSALNLPSGAKVVVNGARIGQLHRITVADPTATEAGSATAEVDIQRSISLPVATRAQLRQDTILGDIYISLDTHVPRDSGTLHDGDTIPMRQTIPALQIEDVISGLATFVSGGALRSTQEIVDQLNSSFPRDPAETARVASVLKDDLIDVSQHLDQSDAFLSGIEANAAAVQRNRDALDILLSAQGAQDITNLAQTLIHAFGIIGAIGGLAHALIWLTPLIQSASAAAEAFVPLLLNQARPLDLTAPSNLNRLSDLLRNKLIPFFEEGPKVSVSGLSVKGDSGTTVSTDQQVDNMIATLRMIGMVR
ncbi:MlaD family protein [Nocardia cyriacigeorgica]|uniref:MlaD family protein n=1 Tax=Nocardia cyriacigeorgica TaxID=135487 RepID=UPI0020182316|nr:MlaD family protein [Nocardia cyriacigeorgica]